MRQVLANHFQVAEVHGQSKFGEEELARFGRICQSPTHQLTQVPICGVRFLPNLRQCISTQFGPHQDVPGLLSRHGLSISNRRLEELLKLGLVLSSYEA